MEPTSQSVRETAVQTEPPAVAEEPELALHPRPRQYVLVAVVLAIATAFEVGLYYLDMPHPLFVGMLLFFATVKFSLVVLWFMHLRFDSAIFRRLFVAGLILAITVYMIVLVIFGAMKAPWLLGIAAFLVVLPLVWAVRTRRERLRKRLRSRVERVAPLSSEHG
ncbi:MAG TPA: cytochrome C oxidase subunit IV family protein [Actinomycetota bacterium]|jgi:cytochrome c oxidase subunit 4